MTRWPRCGGLNVPPRIPTRRRSSANVPVALHEVLVRAQLAQPDRPPGVELLRRVADLGAHPELPAVGEPGRRVHVDARGIDSPLEGTGRVGGPGDDRL